MKTSNKLISLGMVILSLIAISFMIAGKASMVERVNASANDIVDDLNEKLNEEGSKIVQKSLGVLWASKLDLDGNHRYILDPTSNEVVVSGPQKIISEFENISVEDFFEAPTYTEVTSKQDERNDSRVYDRILDTLYYTIGIRDARSLLIFIGNESKITVSSPIQLETLTLFLEGNSHINAELNCSSLEIRSKDAGHVRLFGNARNVDITLRDNSNLECYGLSTQDAEVFLYDNSRLELNAVARLSGAILNNAYYGNSDKITAEGLLVRDNAQVDLN